MTNEKFSLTCVDIKRQSNTNSDNWLGLWDQID